MEEKVIVKRPPKSAALAGILSFFFPGTGALYNRQILKGIIFMIIFAGLVTLQTEGTHQPFMALILAGFYIYQLIDAIQTANAINQRALKGKEEEVAVEEMPEIVKSGSVFWGAVLLVLGAILLLANFDVIDYDTVFDFWPVVIVVIGIKLIIDYIARKNHRSENKS